MPLTCDNAVYGVPLTVAQRSYSAIPVAVAQHACSYGVSTAGRCHRVNTEGSEVIASINCSTVGSNSPGLVPEAL
jgi:hypothetical protein